MLKKIEHNMATANSAVVVDRILTLLDGVTKSGKGWSARCPAHDDEKQSLTVNIGNAGRVLLRCHAGCAPEDVVKEIGLTMADLFRSGNGKLTVEQLAKHKGLPLGLLKKLGVVQENGHVRINYTLPDGSLAPRHRKRTALRAKDGSRWTGDDSDGSVLPYGLNRLDEARKAGYVVIVEGESDCWTLWHHKFPALGIPGATMAKVLEADHLEGIDKVFILHEPDSGGASFVASVSDRLRAIAFKSEVLEVNLDTKDPNELHKRGSARFKSVFKSALASAERIDLEAWPEIDHSEDDDILPFPVEVFPVRLASFVEEVSRSMGCPTDFIGVPMLIVAGAAIGNSRAVELKPGWRERAILMGGCAGSPGTTKSPALSLAVSPMVNAQARLKSEWKIEKEKWSKSSSKERPPKPTLKRVLCNDATVEAMASVLAENARGVLLYRDELTGWTRSMDQYKGRGADRQFWLSCWSGESVAVDRKGNPEPLMIDKPFVSVVGSLTPDMLSELLEVKRRSDGTLERLLIVYPKTPPAERWSEDGVPDKSARRWQEAIDRLLLLEMDGVGPVVVELSPKAKRVWTNWYDSHAKAMDDPGLLSSLIGSWSKMRSHCARLALIVHLLRQAVGEKTGTNIDDESMRRAVKLVDYLKSHAVRIHLRLAGRFAALSDDARAVLNWTRKHELHEFSEKVLWDDLRNRFGSRDAMHKAVDELTRQSLIRPTLTKAKGRGRKPSQRHEVHPSIVGAS